MYIAIVATENNRVSKFAEFSTEMEASVHVSKYGGIVYHNVGGHQASWLKVVDQSVTIEDPRDLSALKIQRVTQAWEHCNSVVEAGTVAFQSDTANTPVDHIWGTDKFSQDVINVKMTKINASLANDVILTPKGELDAVTLTIAEFKLLADAAETQVDTWVKNYLAIKKSIMIASTHADVDAIDITADY